MLPPHRPFRERPVTRVVIKKKTAGAKDTAPEDRNEYTRKNFKAGLVILDRPTEAGFVSKAR